MEFETAAWLLFGLFWLSTSIVSYGMVLRAFQYEYAFVSESIYKITKVFSLCVSIFGPINFLVGGFFFGANFFGKPIFGKPKKIHNRVSELIQKIYNRDNTINGVSFYFSDISTIVQEEFGYKSSTRFINKSNHHE